MSNLTPPDPLQRLQNEVDAIVREVERLTSRKSRWSGRVVVSAAISPTGRTGFFGAKDWNCDIIVHQSRLGSTGLHSTLVHEAFHSVSVGLTQLDYYALPGFEEGVVEQCTRLHRTAILMASGLPSSTDVRTSYPRYLFCLEDLRARTSKAAHDFYLPLLATSLIDREAVVLQWIQQAESAKRGWQIAHETDAIRRRLKT